MAKHRTPRRAGRLRRTLTIGAAGAALVAASAGPASAAPSAHHRHQTPTIEVLQKRIEKVHNNYDNLNCAIKLAKDTPATFTIVRGAILLRNPYVLTLAGPAALEVVDACKDSTLGKAMIEGLRSFTIRVPAVPPVQSVPNPGRLPTGPIVLPPPTVTQPVPVQPSDPVENGIPPSGNVG